MASPPFRARTFLLVTWGVNVCINAFYIAPAPVFPQMIADLGIGKAAAGSLISFYLLAILLFQIPAGYVIDRTDARRVIVSGSLVLLVLSLAMVTVPRYDALLVLRILSGIAVAFVFVPSAFLVARAFERAPGRAIGIFLSAPPAGVALGNLVSPTIAAFFGWPYVLLAFNLPLLALLPLFTRHANGLPPRRVEQFSTTDFLAAFRNRELWKVGLVFAASYAAYIFYSSWTPTYLQETGYTSLAFMGLVSAAVPAAGILSRPFGGYLAETRFADDKRWVPGIAFAVLLVVSLSIPFMAAVSPPLLIASGFLAQFPFSVYYLFSTQVMPAKFGGTAYAFMNSTSLIGGSISPALGGLLVDATSSFSAAFALMAATAVLGLLLTIFVRVR